MAIVKGIVMTMEQILGSDRAILAQIMDNYEYQNGKRTDKKIGHKYEVSCHCNNFEKIVVKVNNLIAFPITQEELNERNSQEDFVYVTFEGFEGKLWQDSSRQIKISATAEKIILVGEDY